jgi:ribosomal protein L29
MAAEKVQQLSTEELRARERELRETLARLHMKRHARRLEKPSELHVAKKDLARVLTAINAKAAGASGRGAK